MLIALRTDTAATMTAIVTGMTATATETVTATATATGTGTGTGGTAATGIAGMGAVDAIVDGVAFVRR